MTKEKIKAILPHTIHILYDLNKNTVSIEHDGGPVNEVIPGCKKTLEWCVKDADLLFKSGADSITIDCKDIPSGGLIPPSLTAEYQKITDCAHNMNGHPQRHTTYVIVHITQPGGERQEFSIDAKQIYACAQRFAEQEKEEQK